MKSLFKKVFSRRNIKLLLALIILIILFWIIANTYSKYINSIDGTANTDIANWNIKINNQNITQNPDFTNVLGFTLDSSQHIKNNVIVPTSSGTFTINLDSTGTDLPFQYDFSIAEDVDTSSTYYTTPNSNPWPVDGGMKYQLKFKIDYTYLDQPIVYRFNGQYYHVVEELHQPWQEGTGWGLVYNGIKIHENGVPLDTETYGSDPVGLPITITLPPGMTLDTVFNNTNYTYDSANNTVTFIPVYYDWLRSDNKGYNLAPDWDPYITLSEYCLENTAEILMELTYRPPAGADPLPENYWTSVSAGGRPIVKKNLSDFRITHYKLNNGPKTALAQGQTNITGIIQPSLNPDGTNTGNQVLNTFQFWAEWYDGPDNASDNYHDVQASKMDNPVGIIPITATMTQVRP